MKPTIFATKSFPRGAENETPAHTAFSLNRSLLEQEDLLGLAHQIAWNFLNEPHGAADTKKVQEALREDGTELFKLAAHINALPDAKARKELTKRYDRIEKKLVKMDMCLSMDRLTSLPGEAKGALPKLLFTVGFPAGFATTLKAMSVRDWVVGLFTGVVWVAAACVAYKSDIDKKWKAVSEGLCSSCDKPSCPAKQNPSSRNVPTAIALAKCYAKARRKGFSL